MKLLAPTPLQIKENIQGCVCEGGGSNFGFIYYLPQSKKEIEKKDVQFSV